MNTDLKLYIGNVSRIYIIFIVFNVLDCYTGNCKVSL